jgi:mono/diheme cytochrome c family protein
MYVSVGSSCNVCLEKDPRRAAILRYRPDGTGEEIFASGLRNAVGFAWHPASKEMFATDNGRDLLGDDLPPCELNRVVRGGFYGWPFASGDRVPDPDLGEDRAAEIAASLPPVHAFRAHNAPLGIAFAPDGAAFVALHGSWNRTRKDGYKVVSLHPDEAGGIRERDFLTGFLEGEDVRGRPVDVAVDPGDAALYVSDDYAGAVYRVARGEGPAPESAPARAATAPPAPPAPAVEVARGRALYAEHQCASCHAAGMRALTGLAARYTRESLADFLRAPTPPMPVFTLDAAARRDLAAFLLEDPRFR